MKTVFINLSLRPGAKHRHLPVGLAYVMTAAKRAGFEFDYIDIDLDELADEDLRVLLQQGGYDVVAFGCIVTGYKYIKKTAELIKEISPRTTIIAGNSVATSIPHILLTHTLVDIAVLGEGDVTIVELLHRIERGEGYHDVQGIAFKVEDKVVFSAPRPVEPDLDRFGFPDWNIFNLEKYSAYLRINHNVTSGKSVIGYPLNSGRGCPHACTFCYHVFRGKKYRRYSEAAIIEEVRRLHQTFGASFISFWDELTFPNTQAVRELLHGLKGLDFIVNWDAPCRAGLLKRGDVDLVREMKALGCDNIAFSLENASPEILAAMNKKISVEQFIEQAETLARGGVTPLTSVIFGYPQETPETIQMTIDVCERCNIFPSVGFLLPLPGTPIYEWAKTHGHIPDEVKYLESIGDRQDFHINLTTMSDETLKGTVEEGLIKLAAKQGLNLDSVFKTTTYQAPKAKQPEPES